MRMRKLGKGQSVIFCIPKEVKSNILELSGKYDQSDIDVSYVLRWAIAETWMDTQRSMPLWATQGQRFDRQCTLWNETCQKDQLQMSPSQAEKFLEPESQTLEQRYRPRHDGFPYSIVIRIRMKISNRCYNDAVMLVTAISHPLSFRRSRSENCRQKSNKSDRFRNRLKPSQKDIQFTRFCSHSCPQEC